MTAPRTFGPWTEDQARHLYALFYDEIGLCGCGQPGAAVDLIRRLLNLAPFYEHPAEMIAEFDGNAGIEHLVLSVLDHVGLTEHGGSIGGSWLTDKGRAVQQLLSLGTADSVDEMLDGAGYPHDGEPCPGHCWTAWAGGQS